MFVLVVLSARCLFIPCKARIGVSSESEGTNQKFIEGEIGLTRPWQQQGAQHNSEQSRGQYYIPQDFTQLESKSQVQPSKFQKGVVNFWTQGCQCQKHLLGAARKYMGHVGWFPAKFI